MRKSTGCIDVVGEGTLERWMALEMRRIRDALVTQPRFLHELMLEDAPAATTRGGEPHPFDKAMLQRFHDALSPLARRRVRLPIMFYVENEAPNEAYVVDEPAVALLHALGEIPASIQPRNGKLWIAHSRARHIAQRWRGAFQFSYL